MGSELTMKYLKVLWSHNFPDEPVELFSEINDDGWEVRKVEIFSDGHSDWADTTQSKGTSMLSEKRMPSIAEIAEQPEFSPQQITPSEFEEIWRQSTTDHA
ncbi:DUF6881 domain-containing protein [Nocardia sp. CA-107356]|uniref:DUF6881 domain-containing protein n=1 Tax=Nocardia sp. CA-107356 TaxID=3239972 RepID=UPI003D916F0A